MASHLYDHFNPGSTSYTLAVFIDGIRVPGAYVDNEGAVHLPEPLPFGEHTCLIGVCPSEDLAVKQEGVLAGSICEVCLDAPALTVAPAPWGGEMGVCRRCRDGNTYEVTPC